MTQSFVQLRSASNKFMEAGEALDDLKKENEGNYILINYNLIIMPLILLNYLIIILGKEIFIPLTSSVSSILFRVIYI